MNGNSELGEVPAAAVASLPPSSLTRSLSRLLAAFPAATDDAPVLHARVEVDGVQQQTEKQNGDDDD